MKTSENKKLLSLIVPAYKQSKTIRQNLLLLDDTLKKLDLDYEIILVIDGKDEKTIQEVKKTNIKKLLCLTYDKNKGKSYAIKLGIRFAKGDWVMFMDAGLEIDPSGIPMLIEHMKWYNADIIVGSKRHPASKVNYTFLRKIYSYGYYYLVKILFNLKIRDTQAGIKIVTKQVIDEILPYLVEEKFSGDLELIVVAKQKGFNKIYSAPIKLNYDFAKNTSAATFKSIKNIFIETLTIFFRLNFTNFYNIHFNHIFNPPKGLSDCKKPIQTQKQKLEKASIIIPVSRITDFLHETISYIDKQKDLVKEVLVVTEKNLKKDPKWPDYVKIIKTKFKGPAIKRDIGAKKASSNILAFLDDDSYPHKNWLKNALIHFTDKKISAVGGPAITPKTDSFIARLSGSFYESFLASANNNIRYLPKKQSQLVDDWPTVNFLINKKDFFEVGGFDSNYYPGEDTKLCFELIKKNKKILYEPKAIVYHHRRDSLKKHFNQVLNYALHRGYFMKKFKDNSLKITYFVPSLFFLYNIFLIFFILFLRSTHIVFIQKYKLMIFIPIILYLFLVFIESLKAVFKYKDLRFLLLVFLFYFSHNIYGFNLIRGLLSTNLIEEKDGYNSFTPT